MINDELIGEERRKMGENKIRRKGKGKEKGKERECGGEGREGRREGKGEGEGREGGVKIGRVERTNLEITHICCRRIVLL
jgi:hypothetical protein